MAVNDVGETNQVIGHLILSLESASRHASRRWARAKFNQAFKLVICKEEILSFDPANGGSKLAHEELNENGVREFLTH